VRPGRADARRDAVDNRSMDRATAELLTRTGPGTAMGNHTDPMHRGVKALDYIKADGNVVFEIEQNPFGRIWPAQG
jgi:hypothetical protein